MGRLHEWKGRLQNQTEGYPFDNGPPFFKGGSAAWPARAGGQFPINGVSVAIAGFPGTTVTATFAGTSTGNMTARIVVAYTDILVVQQVAEVEVPIAVGATAAVIAAAVGAALNAAILDTDMTVAVAGAVVTLTVVDDETQIIDGLYALVANNI